MLQNDLFLRALKGQQVPRPPVWMMRQAGRFLPEFRALRDKYDFFTRCQTPELAAQITLQPINRLGVDAAILFSDILVVPQAMGIEVQMKEQFGPWLPNPIRSLSDVQKIVLPDVTEKLSYVIQAIKLTKQLLDNTVPLIGFAGAPWTIFCYLVQGQSSKTYDIAKSFCFTQPQAAHQLLQLITQTTINYLTAKVQAGVDAVQLFDSWGGVLAPQDYQQFSWQYSKQIISSLAKQVPVIMFAKGCWHSLAEMANSKVSALGIDWTCKPQLARQLVGDKVVLQGNFDPAWLLSPIPMIEQLTKQMIDSFSTQRYIANLGHGILPNVPVQHAQAFVNAVKNYQPN